MVFNKNSGTTWAQHPVQVKNSSETPEAQFTTQTPAIIPAFISWTKSNYYWYTIYKFYQISHPRKSTETGVWPPSISGANLKMIKFVTVPDLYVTILKKVRSCLVQAKVDEVLLVSAPPAYTWCQEISINNQLQKEKLHLDEKWRNLRLYIINWKFPLELDWSFQSRGSNRESNRIGFPIQSQLYQIL